MPIKDKNRPGLKPKAFDNHKYVYRLVKFLKSAEYLQALHVYKHILSDKKLDNFVISKIAERDRFFLLTHVLNRADAFHPWLYDRCREVELKPDGHLDLWAREHYKALDCDTPVFTANRGWVKHIDLKPFDRVFAPNGSQVFVRANTGRMLGADCFSVKTDSGAEIIASGNHLWIVRQKGINRAITTEDIDATMTLPKVAPLRFKRQPFELKKNNDKIIDVAPVASRPVNCIQVIGGNYLAGKDFVPTHNSTIITFAGVIQELIRNRELTIGIFSHTRPIAKAFLAQIKMEMEINEKLPLLWPHIFWANPRKEAPVWSLDSGIIVKRERNPKEASIEAWGLVDGQPISKHFGLMVYDDVVTADNCTPQMIPKTTKAWELSQSLSARNAQKENEKRRFWHIGTTYHFGDTYRVILDRKAVIPRLYPATDTGTPDGDPVFLPVEDWEKKKRDLSPSTLACQYLQNPLAGEERLFKMEWLRYYEVRPETLNVAILVDPADAKSASACNSAFAVLGLDKARNKYLLDGACHKMGLKERWEMLRKLRKKWIRAPGVRLVLVGYEKYGMQADIAYFEEKMEMEKYHFPIQQLNWPREGGHSKNERIERLVPDHQTWQFFYPYDTKKHGVTKRQKQHIDRGQSYLVSKPIMCVDNERKLYNLVDWFITNEYSFYPTSVYKDFLDAMSRIYDLNNFKPPTIYHERDLLPEAVEDY